MFNQPKQPKLSLIKMLSSLLLKAIDYKYVKFILVTAVRLTIFQEKHIIFKLDMKWLVRFTFIANRIWK